MNNMSGLLEDLDDPLLRYGFIVICKDCAAFGICEKNCKLGIRNFMLL